jgi:transcriptional regulator with XRE-family HTH domain
MAKNRYVPRTELHAYLDRARMSQKGLAERMQVDQPTVSFWLSGRRIPQDARITQMAEIFQVTPESLRALFIAENMFYTESGIAKHVVKHLAKIVENRVGNDEGEAEA